VKLKAQRSTGRKALAVTQLTPETIIHAALDDPSFANYVFLSLVKHPPYIRATARSARWKRRTMGTTLRDLVVSRLANDLFGHIKWEQLAALVVQQEAMRRYITKRYPAAQVKLRRK